MCRATGATLLLAGGLFILWFCSRVNSKVLFLRLGAGACRPITQSEYPTCGRGSNSSILWGYSIVGIVWIPWRIASMRRTYSPKERWRDRFGGGVHGEGTGLSTNMGEDKVATDGLWILMLGNYGFAGLLSWTVFMLLPAYLFLRRFPVSQWATPAIGPLAAIATLDGLYMVDCLSNGFFNLVYLVGSGGLICTLPSGFRTR